MYEFKSNIFFMNSKLQIELSIIVCTRNRAKQLATLIQCLGSQKNIEKLNWEIVIVDNNSNDNTKEVAYAFCEGSNLKIRYIFESKIGLSYARNAGISISKGKYILFLDDDVLIPQEFISNALFALQEFDEFDIFGFRVLPDWEVKQVTNHGLQNTILKSPFWLALKKPFNLIQSFLPIHDLGKEPLQYPNRYAKNPIGASFLVKKKVFEELGLFREDLGAGQSGLCEDTEFFWYAMLNDHKILYWPYASLYHPVIKERLSIFHLHKWYFNLGKSIYLIKATGRIQKELSNGKWKSQDKAKTISPELRKLASLLTSGFFFKTGLKLFLLVLFLPLSIILLFIKRPFYLSTLLGKALGEIWQGFQMKLGRVNG